jgi:hypothetical protein
MSEFKAFTKIARLSRMMTITEKIDGTNAQIYIKTLEGFPDPDPLCLVQGDGLAMFAGSRTRWITPESDNYGFAAWAKTHAEKLFTLGEGRHFGEWWGAGIQRGYGQKEKRFSLFNTRAWLEDFDNTRPLCPACCRVVPVLYRGMFDTDTISITLDNLSMSGSQATPFMDPEGVVVFHEAAGIMFKKTFKNDNGGKEQSAVKKEAVV